MRNAVYGVANPIFIEPWRHVDIGAAVSAEQAESVVSTLDKANSQMQSHRARDNEHNEAF